MRKLIDILFIYLPLTFLILSFSAVLVYKWVPVTWTPLMLKRALQNQDDKEYSNTQVWVDLEYVDQHLIKAILSAEDQRFYMHKGFDLVELKKMKKEHESDGKKLRGCSTISQQVAKNCFTFCSNTFIRKGIEAYFTILIEALWSKERILEVYLNIAETGKGIFGVEAVCQKYFRSSSSDITPSDAAAIACVLPNPLKYTPYNVLNTHHSKYSRIVSTLTLSKSICDGKIALNKGFK